MRKHNSDEKQYFQLKMSWKKKYLRSYIRLKKMMEIDLHGFKHHEVEDKLSY